LLCLGMKLEATEHQVKNGLAITIRSLASEDASLAVAYMRTMYASSRFLAREAEEWNITIEDETAWLQKAEADDKRLLLGAFCGGQLVGLCDFSPVSPVKRMVHRSQCGLSVAPDFQNKGIGRLLMHTLLEKARQAGYEQMELEVVSSNFKAVNLYNQLNFTKCGTIERGMKYQDGTYADLDIMLCWLT